MISESDSDTKVQRAIFGALTSHIKSPFSLLREDGFNACLKRFLDLQFKKPVPLAIEDRSIGPKPDGTRHTMTNRVQMELKIQVPSEDEAQAQKNTHQRTDIVILGEHPQMTCERGGPGDIIAAVKVEFVSAAIEVKAAPSHRLDVRRGFANDIGKLLDLVSRNPRGHEFLAEFVILDKSSSLYGVSHKKLPGSWEVTCIINGKDVSLSDLVGSGDPPPECSYSDIVVSKTTPGRNKKYVRIWFAAKMDGDPEYKVYKAYAYRVD